MTPSIEVPQSIADLLTDPARIRRAFEMLRSLEQLQAAIDGRVSVVKFSPENSVIDLTGILRPGFELPDQGGQAGKFLTTDGVSPSWGTGGGGVISSARVVLSGNQSIPNAGSGAYVSWGSAEYDTGGYWSAGSPTRLTIPADGRYFIRSSFNYALNAVGERYNYVVRGGADVLAKDQRNGVAAGSTVVNGVTVLALTAGQYVEAQAYQNSGGALDISADPLTNFTIDRLA